jgi:hypothetical protein
MALSSFWVLLRGYRLLPQLAAGARQDGVQTADDGTRFQEGEDQETAQAGHQIRLPAHGHARSRRRPDGDGSRNALTVQSSRNMTPAPKKPMPVTVPAAIRSSTPVIRETSVKRAAPIATRVMVRTPEG